ncbi:hypothetical protein VFPFJ_01430 [Purpureocillium lilacinum]|uniref:Uncharacterized protein n=1 Tax=Purpureocillium lilacinum TaxID=33203 RepID=A0A179I113_PURLI|nr:hypothetical protein VFPFJ_01430 [Purpureocillium lilacinum]OAQ95320.1 hypothetical protein VFPFJ_01430 [Purpureocillium lilacinum]
MLTCTTNFQVTCAPLEYPGLAATVPTSLDAAVEPPPPTPGLRRCYSVERQRRPTLRLRSRNNGTWNRSVRRVSSRWKKLTSSCKAKRSKRTS